MGNSFFSSHWIRTKNEIILCEREKKLNKYEETKMDKKEKEQI